MKSLPARVLLVVVFFPFITLKILCHPLLTCKVSAEKSANSLMGVLMYVICCFPLFAFNILSLSLIFAIFTTVCLGVVLFELILFGTFSASCAWMSASFYRLGIFFNYYVFKYVFSPFPLSSPSEISIK